MYAIFNVINKKISNGCLFAFMGYYGGIVTNDLMSEGAIHHFWTNI